MSEEKCSQIERTKEGRFPKGVSGNPTGRPKTKTLSKAYREKLEELVPNDPKNRAFAQMIADALVIRAAKGDVAAAVELCDRCEGRVRQAMTEIDDEFASMSVEELAQEFERTRAEHSGEPDTKTSPDDGYTN